MTSFSDTIKTMVSKYPKGVTSEQLLLDIGNSYGSKDIEIYKKSFGGLMKHHRLIKLVVDSKFYNTMLYPNKKNVETKRKKLSIYFSLDNSSEAEKVKRDFDEYVKTGIISKSVARKVRTLEEVRNLDAISTQKAYVQTLEHNIESVLTGLSVREAVVIHDIETLEKTFKDAKNRIHIDMANLRDEAQTKLRGLLTQLDQAEKRAKEKIGLGD